MGKTQPWISGGRTRKNRVEGELWVFHLGNVKGDQIFELNLINKMIWLLMVGLIQFKSNLLSQGPRKKNIKIPHQTIKNLNMTYNVCLLL